METKPISIYETQFPASILTHKIKIKLQVISEVRDNLLYNGLSRIGSLGLATRFSEPSSPTKLTKEKVW